ncbi:MAG: ribosomal RNA small subunit methyltransferase A [Candidatus Nomurabacteria bacterium]|nr:MAG: ribosomal RNA small subunit methyltransferase A [Candidatus Nomurabacteria bacterium]
MNPSEIKVLLEQLGGAPNKRLGQHFLIDGATLETIVEAGEIQEGDTVLEIGPGLGVLTNELLDRGANVIAIEKDKRYAAYHESRKLKNLKIVLGDAIQLDWLKLVGKKPWKFIANLPYAITSYALRLGLWSKHPPECMVVLVQKEVAERAISRDGKQSLLSLMVALVSSEMRILRKVPPGCFYPPPRVDSAVLYVKPMPVKDRANHWGIEPEQIMLLAKKGFAKPRKLLRSNIDVSEDQSQAWESLGINPKARAEDLSPRQWAELAKTVK